MMRRMLTMVPIAVAAVTLGAPTLHADTYTVNSTADAVDAAPGNTVCATATGVCTLRAAVQEANAHAGADVIELPAGTFALTLIGAGEDLAATGDLDVTDQLDIDGAGREATVIDGIYADRIIQTGSPLAVRDLTLRHGSASGGLPVGGAIFQLSVSPTTIERVRFEGNRANVAGGGIVSGAGPLTVSDSVFESNAVFIGGTTGGGGAIGISGAATVTITNTEFTANATFGGKGGGALIAISAGPSGGVNIANSTFSGNSAMRDGASPPNGGDGGAVFCDIGGPVSITGSTFSTNSTTAIGGAFRIMTTANVVLTDLTVTGNFAATVGGGLAAGAGVQASGGEYSDNIAIGGTGGGLFLSGTTSVTAQDAAFRRNSGGFGNGGGLVVTGAVVAVSNLEATENSAVIGGGLLLQSAGTLTATRIRAINNGSTSQGGGLVALGPTVTLTDSTIDGNFAGSSGGGGLLSANDLVVSGSTFSNNRSAGTVGFGGGALFASTNPGTITNCTVSGNVADVEGGGVFANGPLTFRNVTLANNDAPMGSAIFNMAGILNLTSSIVAGPAASHCAGVPITSLGFNIDSTTTCGLAGPSDQTNTDPQLGPLQDNGGPTFTHLAGTGSPALDKGNPTGCPATDQRGQTRPTDGDGNGTATCDVGATEYFDLCPNDPNKTEPGVCGCGVPEPGACGCGVPDTDVALANGVPDCFINGEFKARLARSKDIVNGLTGDASDDGLAQELTAIADGLDDYMTAHTDLQLTSTKPKPAKLVKRIQKAAKKVVKAKAGNKLTKAKKRALKALDALDAIVAPQT